MARRKPSNVADDIVGGIRKIVSPWLGAPPAQNRQVTQAQGLARGAAETLDQAFAGGMVKAGVQGNQALAKQAAVNAAALGTGYIAGKAIQTGRVVNPVAAVRNFMKGEKVVVHGTPRPLQGKFLEPRAETWGAQDIGKPVVYNFDPRVPNAKSNIPYRVQEYSNPSLYFNPDLKSNFNAVIGRTPASSMKTHQATGYRYSESPISIDRVVKTNKPPEQLSVELQRELRKMGTQMRGQPISERVKNAIIKNQNKKMRNYRQ